MCKGLVWGSEGRTTSFWEFLEVRCGCGAIRDWAARRVVGLVGDVGSEMEGREVRRPPTGSFGAESCRECVGRVMS